VSNFEHVNFAINGKYSKKNYDNPNYYASLVIFQTYKNVVLSSVHSFGWLLNQHNGHVNLKQWLRQVAQENLFIVP
jgi:hypothetical protein